MVLYPSHGAEVRRNALPSGSDTSSVNRSSRESEWYPSASRKTGIRTSFLKKAKLYAWLRGPSSTSRTGRPRSRISVPQPFPPPPDLRPVEEVEPLLRPVVLAEPERRLQPELVEAELPEEPLVAREEGGGVARALRVEADVLDVDDAVPGAPEEREEPAPPGRGRAEKLSVSSPTGSVPLRICVS